MKKQLLIVVLLLWSSFTATAQSSWLWATAQSAAPDSGATVRTTDIATDLTGHSYVTGSFSGTARFGSFTLTSRGASDLFIAKYSPNGAVVWATHIGQSAGASPFYTTTAAGNSIALDEAGNCYVTGEFSNEVSYDTGGILQAFNPAFNSMLVAKCNARGEIEWAKRAGISQFSCSGLAVAADAAGNCYVTGRSDFGNIQFDDRVAGEGRRIMFVASYAAQGQVRWVNTATSTAGFGVSGTAVTVDSRGACLVSGNFNVGMAIEDRSLQAAGEADAYLARLSSATGRLQWLRQAGGPGTDVATALATDPQGNVYLAGSYAGTASFGSSSLTSSGSSDVYVARYSRAGQLAWAQSIGTAAAEQSAGLCVGLDGTSTVVCLLPGSTPDQVRTVLHSLTPRGNFLGTEAVGGPGSCRALSVASPRPRQLFVAGAFSGAVRFGRQHLSSPTEAAHGFVARLLLAPRSPDYSVEEDAALQVFPNPATSHFTAQLATRQATTGTAALYNSLGHIVRSQPVSATSPTLAAAVFDCSTLPAGLYVLQLRTTDGTVTSREVQVK